MASWTDSATRTPARQTTFERLQDICGLLYILSSACTGIIALGTFRDYMDNNWFWPTFQSSGIQILLADLLNMHLGSLSLGTSSVTLLGRLYMSYNESAIAVSPLYARSILYTEATATAPAIASIRQANIIDIASMALPYCWVDFDRRWELALTRGRQARCDALERRNGAMYFEAVHRNVDFAAWMHAFHGPFMSSIGDAVQSTPGGEAWVAALALHKWVPVDAESAYWRAHDVTVFSLNWSNGHRPGISEVFGIQNAAGVTRFTQIKDIAAAPTVGSTRTSFTMTPSLLFAMTATSENQSLVQNHESWFGRVDPLLVQRWLVQDSHAMGADAVKNQVGPLGAIDMKFVAPPDALRQYVALFHSHVNNLMLDVDGLFGLVFQRTLSYPMHPTPSQWSNTTIFFSGATLFCLGGHSTEHIQESFRFDESCNGNEGDDPLQVAWSPLTSVFAATLVDPALLSQAAPLCHAYDACHELLGITTMLLDGLHFDVSTTLQQSVVATTTELNMTIMQFTWSGVEPSILTHPILDAADPWTVFGWMMVYEWAIGYREVVAFHGDVATLTLVSRSYPPDISSMSERKVAQSVATSLWCVAVYVSAVLSLVAAVIALSWLPSQHSLQRNWFVFNRVAGSSWIGRPFLVVRGVIAMLCLSTAPVTRSSVGDMSVLVLSSRSVWTSLLLSGETLWVTYVLNELGCHGTTPNTHVYAPCSCVLVWALTALVDTVCPPEFGTVIDRHCQVTAVTENVVCTSGTVIVGRPLRLMLLVWVQLGSVLVAISTARLCRRVPRSLFSPTLLLPGVVTEFMHETSGPPGFWSLDRTSLAMAGILRLTWQGEVYLFDINLWLFMKTDHFEFQQTDHILRFPHAFKRFVVACRSAIGSTNVSSKLRSASKIKLDKVLQTHQAIRQSLRNITAKSTPLRKPARLTMVFPSSGPPPDHLHGPKATQRSRLKEKLMAVVALLYVLSTLVGSIVYATETATAVLGNDFYWANFNTSTTHVFLATLINVHTLNSRAKALPLNNATLVASAAENGTTMVSTIVFSDTLARRELYQAAPLDLVIRNLRAMDPCAVPHMFTQYCWVDFQRQWEMAATATRQARCLPMRKNGALYLEGVLRNVRSQDEWNACWGRSFYIGFEAALQETMAGRNWLAATRRGGDSVASEVEYWSGVHGIADFVLQWQSMRSVGMSDVIRVKNALGFEYPISLSAKLATSSSDPTSSKLYWGFASDLWVISINGTDAAGRSLIRSSPHFAFANLSRETLLVANDTLAAPYMSGFAQFADVVGPFGIVDMVYIPCPTALDQLYIALIEVLSDLMYTDVGAHKTYHTLSHDHYITAYPPQWLGSDIAVTGGNILCGNDNAHHAATSPQETVLYAGFSTSRPCQSTAGDYFAPDEYLVIFALLAFDANHKLTTSDLEMFCAMDSYADLACAQSYALVVAFLAEYKSKFEPLRARAVAAFAGVKPLHVELIQFIVHASEPSMYRVELLDAVGDRAWLFFSWCFLYDWVAGQREVVSFQGDAGTIATISASYTPLELAPKSTDLPTDLSLVLWACVQYMTVLMCVLAFFVLMYAVTSRGKVEEANVFRMSRLVGLVWAGRPFIFARSISAMLYLNTATLLLAERDGVLRFESAPQLWYDLILASMELQWFVFVLNDAFSCVTQHYTSFYAGKSAWAASFAVWIWMQLRSNFVTARLNRVCVAVNMDFALQCDTGVVEIGRVSYVFTSIAICVGSVVGCFVMEKYVRQSGTALDIPSLLLSSQAKYLIHLSEWLWCGTYYVDKSTALMAGVLSFEWNQNLYMFDIKKWRYFTISRSALNDAAPDKFKHAIPILE